MVEKVAKDKLLPEHRFNALVHDLRFGLSFELSWAIDIWHSELGSYLRFFNNSLGSETALIGKKRCSIENLK